MKRKKMKMDEILKRYWPKPPKEEVEAAGGKVMTIPLEPGWSTTNLVDRIRDEEPRLQ